MLPVKESQSFMFPSDHSSAALNHTQEKTNLVQLSEVKIPAEKYRPRAAMFFPMSRAVSNMTFSEWKTPNNSFKSLANNAEILSEFGFSEQQISGMLSGSDSHLPERVDRLAKFTQPKIESYDEVICLLPSELEYLSRAGLSKDHISDMLFGSGEYLPENIEALKDFVTPWIQYTNEQGVSGVRSPLQILEELGRSKDRTSHFFKTANPMPLELRIKKVLYLIHCTKNVVFENLFKDEDVKRLSIFNSDGMTQDDAREILEIFGVCGMSRDHSEASFLSGYSDDMMIEDFIEDMGDINQSPLNNENYILDIFNYFSNKT